MPGTRPGIRRQTGRVTKGTGVQWAEPPQRRSDNRLPPPCSRAPFSCAPESACQTLGDLGDIILVDWSKYRTIQKTEGMRSDVSMHLWFDYDTLAYRFIIRLAGNGWYSAPITPKNSSNTLSPFVTLAARG